MTRSKNCFLNQPFGCHRFSSLTKELLTLFEGNLALSAKRLSLLPGAIPSSTLKWRVQIAYDVSETRICQTGVCNEAAKTLGPVGTPRRRERWGTSRLWTSAPPEDPDRGETFQRVSAKGLLSCSSLRGSSPQGERRLPDLSGRGRGMVMETGLGAGAGRPPCPAFIWMQSSCSRGGHPGGQQPSEAGMEGGAGGSPGARAGALRRPRDPTRRACPRGPPGCWMISADAECSDD